MNGAPSAARIRRRSVGRAQRRYSSAESTSSGAPSTGAKKSPSAVAPPHAPRLGVVVAARIELDPVPAELAPGLERGIHQVGGGGLAIVEMAPERDRRAVDGASRDRGVHAVARRHGRLDATTR